MDERQKTTLKSPERVQQELEKEYPMELI